MTRNLPIIRELAPNDTPTSYSPLNQNTITALQTLGSLEEIFRLGELIGMRRAFLRQNVNPWSVDTYTKQHTDVIENCLRFDPNRAPKIADVIEAVEGELTINNTALPTIDFVWCTGDMVFGNKKIIGGFVTWNSDNPVKNQLTEIIEELKTQFGPAVSELDKTVKRERIGSSPPYKLWDIQYITEEVFRLPRDSETGQYFTRSTLAHSSASKVKSSLEVCVTTDIAVFLKMMFPNTFL